MVNIIDAIYSMVGNLIDLPKDEDTPEKRVEKIFTQMDMVIPLSYRLYSKTCIKLPLKMDKTKILMTNGSLMKV